MTEEQISELQSGLDNARDDIVEVTSTLSSLSDQVSDLDQTTSTSLAELEASLETIEDIVSELTDLEIMINQLLDQTPMRVYDDAYKSVVVIRTPVAQGSGFLFSASNIIVTNYHVVRD